MTKKSHKKKTAAGIITRRRFSAVVAMLLIALSVGLGYLWFRGSQAAPGGTGLVVRIYDVTGGQKKTPPLAGASIYVRIFQVNDRPITESPIPFNQYNGIGQLGGFECIDWQYCQFLKVNFSQFTNMPAGTEIAPSSPVKPNGWLLINAGASNYTELHVRYPDSDGDGVVNKDDRCVNQAGPASNGGCPVPAPVATPKPAAPKPAAPKATTSTTARSTAAPRSVATTTTPSSSGNATATGSAPVDATPPSAPTELNISSPSSGLVTLTWKAATDDTGVTRYSVERSTDKVAWDMLDDNIIETTYTDSTAAYSQKQYYRVIAYDAATNASASVDGEIVTSEFQANAKSDEEAVISSDNALVSATIPAGALSEEADCRITEDNDIEVTLPDGNEAKSPPYRLVCKKADGGTIDRFNQPVRYSVNVDAEAIGELTPVLFAQQDGSWQKSEAAYNASEGGFSLEADTPQTLLVAGARSSNLLPMIVTGAVLLLLAIAGGIWFIRSRGGSGGSSGSDTASYMTGLATSAPPVSATPATPNPINDPSTPSPQDYQPPGQHHIVVPSGEVTAPFEGQQAPLAEQHHSPLDRLEEKQPQAEQ